MPPLGRGVPKELQQTKAVVSETSKIKKKQGIQKIDYLDTLFLGYYYSLFKWNQPRNPPKRQGISQTNSIAHTAPHLATTTYRTRPRPAYQRIKT
jgi:hypothetical protein